jgi:predicted amidohydrolase YtcJ
MVKQNNGFIRTLAGLSLVICATVLSTGCSSPEQSSQTDVTPASQLDVQPGPDYVFLNGKVLTVDEDFSIVEAVAVTGNAISAVGSNDDLAGLAGENTQVIDLDGRTMTPGLIDNHNHLIYTATIWPNVVRLGNVRTRAGALQAIADKAAELGPGDGPAYTVFGFGGWKALQFADDPSEFTREELDAVAPDNPVIVGGWSSAYSSATINSKAMNFAGITKDTPDPADPGDGRILRDENGEPTGQFLGSVFIKWSLRTLFSEVTGPAVVTGLKAEIDDYLELGVTTSQTYNSPEFPEPLFDYLRENFADTTEQKMRIYYPPQFGNAETATSPEEVPDVVEGLGAQEPFTGSDMFQLTHFGEHVYRHIPGNDGNVSEETWALFKEIATAAAANGWQVTEHAHRNSIMEREIEIYEEINQQYPITDLRWRIDHATTLSPDLLDRMKALGMLIAIHSHIAITSPESRASLDWWREALEVRDTPPLAAIRESGIVYGFGSDGQTAGQDSPFFSMWWLVTGKDTTGQPYFTRGTLSREEALIGYTRSNAYLMFKEDKLGTIEVGKLADLVVLNRDYMTVPEDDIRDLKSVLTMVDGRIVYKSADFSDAVASN